MRILHQFGLMTSNGFGILLIPLEQIEERYIATWEGLPRTTGRISKERMNWYDNNGRGMLDEPP